MVLEVSGYFWGGGWNSGGRDTRVGDFWSANKVLALYLGGGKHKCAYFGDNWIVHLKLVYFLYV